MSIVCILAPMVITAWPTFSAAVVSTASALGFTIISKSMEEDELQASQTGIRPSIKKVDLEIENSEVVFDRLNRDEKIVMTREGVTITFGRDARNKASLCVQGEEYSEEQLRQIGEELGRRVVQEYVYQKIKSQLVQMQGIALEESREEDNSIRIKVRTWQ